MGLAIAEVMEEQNINRADSALGRHLHKVPYAGDMRFKRKKTRPKINRRSTVNDMSDLR